MSVNKTRKHKKVKYSKHRRTNKVANKVAKKVANKTKRHRRHRVHKKNKKRATKKHLRGGDKLVGINPFYYGDKNCQDCEKAEKERGMAHYLKEQIENFLTKQKDNNKVNKKSISDFIDNLKIGDNIDESDQMKDFFNNFMDNQNKDDSLNKNLKNFVEQYDKQSRYCESCQETLPPPPLPPRRQGRLRLPPPPPKEEEVDLCNPIYNVNVKERNEKGECICNYGSIYDENAGTCLCEEGFKKNHRGRCIEDVPEGVYGVTPGQNKKLSRRSSKPSGDCSDYNSKETCDEQSSKCGWSGTVCEDLYPYSQVTQPTTEETDYASWPKVGNMWRQ